MLISVQYPLPNTDDLLVTWAGGQVFSKTDLSAISVG